MKRFVLFSILSFLILIFLKMPVFTDKKNTNLIGVKYIVKENQTFFQILKNSSIQKTIRDSIVFYLEQLIDLSLIKPGEIIYIYKDSNLRFKKCIYEKNSRDIYEVLYEKNRFIAQKQDIKKRINIAYISGRIKTNIYDFLIANNEDPILISQLASIFSPQIDFNEQSVYGTKFEIIVEKIFINNQFLNYGKILYASIETESRLYEAFYYKDNDFGEYYDRDGNCLSGGIMKVPMAFYNRISSDFTTKRFHPILKKYLPHMAIDYAAPRGTPVYAAADGKIIMKFYDRYGGKILIIEHEDDYMTEYMHLSKYSKRSIVGNYVKQGDIIGFVGRTGKTTGSHLHFAVKYKGNYINPRKIRFIPYKTLSPNEMYYFDQYTEMMYDFLFAVKSISSFPMYFSKKQYMFEYASIINKSSRL